MCLAMPNLASAAEIDFSAPILGLDGKPTPSCSAKTPECERPFSLGALAGLALSRGSERPNSGAADKLRRGQLALKVYGATKLELPIEDVALIKQAIEEVAEPIAVARATALLDPPARAR
jgi:hypothetical protein